MKAVRSNIKISPHGGAVPILKKIKEFGIPQVIRSCLGTRKKQSKYGYDDVLIAWVLTALCGGTRLDHITKLKKKLNIIPGLKIPSHDTLGRVMKKLATEVETKTNTHNRSQATTTFNENLNLNRTLVKATKRAGALQEHRTYTLDIDATFIPTECRGAIRKKNDTDKVDVSKIGFNPMICLINELPVFISMRDGYASPAFELNRCVETCLNNLEESNIKIGKVISDAAGYNKEMFETLQSRGIKFLVRFPYQSKMETFKSALDSCNNWRETEIRTANFNWICEVGDVPYKMFDHYTENRVSKTWRVVAMRVPVECLTEDERIVKKINKEKLSRLAGKKKLKEAGKPYAEGKWSVIGRFKYKFYITNDFGKTCEELITEYNKRGMAERVFSFMKSEFAWRLPPFMNMNENTVFMIAAALANNIFVGMRNIFKKIIPQIKSKSRLKEFQFIFIDVACAYIDKTYIFYNTDIEYELLI